MYYNMREQTLFDAHLFNFNRYNTPPKRGLAFLAWRLMSALFQEGHNN